MKFRPQLHRVVGRSGSPEWQLDRPLEARVEGRTLGRIDFMSLMTPVVWAALVTNPLTAPADGTNSVSQRQPTEGRQVIGASVTDIQVVFGFQLSPLDWANGSSAFSLIQPPTTITATAGTPQRFSNSRISARRFRCSAGPVW